MYSYGRKTTMQARDVRKRSGEHGGTIIIGSADVSQDKAHLQAVPVLLAGVARCQLFDENICGVLASQLAGDDANLQSLHTFQCRCSCRRADKPNTHHMSCSCAWWCAVISMCKVPPSARTPFLSRGSMISGTLKTLSSARGRFRMSSRIAPSGRCARQRPQTPADERQPCCGARPAAHAPRAASPAGARAGKPRGCPAQWQVVGGGRGSALLHKTPFLVTDTVTTVHLHTDLSSCV